MNNVKFTLKLCKSLKNFCWSFCPNIFYMENPPIYFYISCGTRYYEKVYRPQNFDIGKFSVDTAEAAR
jgi:hypothetical protein